VQHAQRTPGLSAVRAAFHHDVVLGLIGGLPAAFGKREHGSGLGDEHGGNANRAVTFGAAPEHVREHRRRGLGRLREARQDQCQGKRPRRHGVA